MAGESINPRGAFDLKKVRRLIELMDEHDLSEVDLKEGDMRIRLRRRQPHSPIPLATVPSAGAALAPQEAPDGRTSPAEGAAASSPTENLLEITSPMVGTFYAASAPDAEPYVQVGSPVSADTTVCIIEAMKVFNEIEAEVSGEIAEVLVANGEPVEFGQPLFRVRPSN